MKPWTSQDPFWQRLEGSNQVRRLVRSDSYVFLTTGKQYPNHPGAQSLVEEYITGIDKLAQSFVHLVAECLSLPSDTFDEFKGKMSRLKFVKYPQSAPESQGVGPHKDSAGLFTFLSQDDSGGLQVLNKNGEWIDVPPVDGSLVINIQQGFEAITGGVCAATTHRVVVSGFLTHWFLK
jgi:isopenicillin N synthase-like dioxygenase